MLSDLCSCTPNALATPAHFLSQLQSPEGLGTVREAVWIPEESPGAAGQRMAGATASTGSSEGCCERAACWKQIQANPTAQEPYAIVLSGFRALQAHLGLSRHANPALINSQHFPLPLSRLAFLLPPSPHPGALCQAWGSWMVPQAELSQATQACSSPAALLQLSTKLVKRRCPMANPRAANSTEPRQPQEHQHSWVQAPLSPALKSKPRSPSPGCSPTQLTSLSPVLIRAPKLSL